MKAVFLACIFLASLVACDTGSSYAIKKLPSGREVKILSVGRIYSTKEEAWILRMRYETALSLENPAALQPEVDDIWNHFQVDANQSGLMLAVITAVEPSKVPGVKIRRQFGFLYFKDKSGVWRPRSASQQPSRSSKGAVVKATPLVRSLDGS